jgi:hypothetical protein
MVRGRFCVKRCSPSRHRLRDTSAVLENFARHPKNAFSTLSARSGHWRSITSDLRNVWGALNQRPFLGEERKTSARAECFSVSQTGRRPSVLRGGIKFRFDYRAQVATSETLPPRKGSLMETRRRSCTKMLGKCGGEADIRDQREIPGHRLSPIVSRRPATKC